MQTQIPNIKALLLVPMTKEELVAKLLSIADRQEGHPNYTPDFRKMLEMVIRTSVSATATKCSLGTLK